MKKKLPLLSNVFVLIAGILLIILHGKVQILEMIIIMIGIMFTVPSCLALIAYFARDRQQGKIGLVSVLPITGGLILGIALVAVPGFFSSLLAYTFATLLIIGAVYKIWGMLALWRTVRFPIGFYLIPTAMLVCGIVILTTGVRKTESALVLITGIAFVAYSINSLLEFIAYRRFLKQQPSPASESAGSIIEIKDN